MASFLEEYGEKEARRERLIRSILRLSAALLVAALAVALLYRFYLRDYREKRQLETFYELLRKQDYPAAYRLWGCSVETPCPQYGYEKFLEDWGPQSPHGDIAAARVTDTRSCEDGVIQTLRFRPDDEVWLWVDRSSRTIGYAPWPVCRPRVPIARPAP